MRREARGADYCADFFAHLRDHETLAVSQTCRARVSCLRVGRAGREDARNLSAHNDSAPAGAAPAHGAICAAVAQRAPDFEASVPGTVLDHVSPKHRL